MIKFKKSELAIIRWYNQQIKSAWEEKNGVLALQLEKEVRAIGMDISKEVRKRINN